MSTQTKTLTYHYRLYHYRNELGQEEFKVKFRRFGVYWWCRVGALDDFAIRCWGEKELALKWINADADERRNGSARSAENARKSKFKLVITEDIQA